MKRMNPSISLGVISLGAIGAISGVMLDGALTPTGTKAFPANAYTYGTDNGLTVEQSAAIDYLAWPQSYDAITSRFGSPDARSNDGTIDYYRRADGAYVGLQYDASNRAVGTVQ